MAAAATMTWHEELDTLVGDTGVRLPGGGGDAAPAAAEGGAWYGEEEEGRVEEGWAQQARGFAESTSEMLRELGRGLWDVAAQSLDGAEDSELARRLRRLAAAAGKRLSFMNEYLPEDRDPVRCWLVVAAVAFVTLLVLGVGSGDETPVEQPKKLYISPPSATRIQLPDGRHLAYEEQGVSADRARFSLIAPHSFLSSRLAGIPGINTSFLEEFGARLVTYDLPGFGESDPHPDRNLNSSALDMLHLADALGIVDKFWVVGYSGGGMHAWSALRYIPDRVAGAAMFAPMANPYDSKMTKDERCKTWDRWSTKRKLMHILARRFPSLLPLFYHRSFLSGKQGQPESWLALSLGKKDKTLLEGPMFNAFWEKDVAESVRQGDAQPFVQEAVLQVSDWGFSLSDIQMQKKEDQGLFELIKSLFNQAEREWVGFLGPIHIWQWKRANAVLQHLVQSMKVSETLNTMLECSSCSKPCHNTPELPLSEYFTDTPSNNISNKGLLWGDNRSSTAFNLLSPSDSFPYMEGGLGINTTASASQRSEINQLLGKDCSIFAISDIERIQILTISDLLGEITDQNRASPYKILDEAGRRFWVAVQFQHLYALRRAGDSSSAEGCRVDSASIAWAFQSDCQDDLLNYVLPAESTWLEIQNLGIGLWYTNVSQLRTRMEKLARLQYLKSKDPKDCALLYIALNRIKVLVGLFKISKDGKDKRLYEFLSRNFQEEKHKAAALKNAYVLMGRHQWELAIAFFLLGGDTSSAITVCAKNLQDEQLAIVICRLVEGSGGPLERNLISNVLLPDAVEKGDHWLSSLLEWMLGNYSQSVNELFGCHPKSLIDKSNTRGDQNVFADPEVGQYCAILATKNNFRNCVGEAQSAKLSKFSFAMAACALNRCGLPLEALECLSCNSSIDGKDSTSSLHGGDDKIFYGILNPFYASSNWLSSSVVSDIESNLKITMASKYLSLLLRNHSFCSQCGLPLTKEYNSHHIEELARDVKAAISIFDKRFSLKFADIAEKILTFCCNHGLLFLAYVLLWGSRAPDVGTDSHGLEGCTLRPIDYLFLVSCKESCQFLTRYVVSCCFMCSVLNVDHTNTKACSPKESRKYIIASLSHFLSASRLLLKHGNSRTSVLDNTSAIRTVLDLLEYTIEFSFSWLCRNIKALLIMINPVLGTSVNGESFQVLLDRLMQAAHHRSHGISINTEGGMPNGSLHKRQPEKSEDSSLSIDEKWHLIGASLWIRLSSFMKHYLTEYIEKERLELEASASDVEFKAPISSVAAKLVMDSLHVLSSSLVKLDASFFREKLPKNLHLSVLFWLEYKSSQPRSNKNSHDQLSSIFQLANSENMEVLFNILWEISTNPVDICTAFVNEEVNCFPLNSINLTRSWKDMVGGTTVECENNFTQRSGEKYKYSVSSKNNEKGQRFIDKASSDMEISLEPTMKGLIEQKDFQSPRELLRRNGELLEAICLNSINEQQVAIATNRKGLVFFNWNEKQHNNKLAEYIWSGSDWPLDGWAGCESTPTATFISPSVGLGRRRGSPLGSGGTTIGGSLPKPGRDLTGGGAFGIPGYAGIGASGFGWGEPDELEDFVDPPATLENIHSRALSRHPSLPLLLVGSSNTHVYLWEFGKDSAMATYGVLPAANIPPPYALASISAVQFDYYGQRFATAALDGTICTWQVEVGGRSNVHPTESSLCFNSHASDVAYVAASGSVLAAAGCSSNGANVVIWDTLAPPATCQTSIMCHEGGARSFAVFDNDIGSGSIPPLIVTGGKSGDVALHDFRFISTGKTKHHRSSKEHDVKASSMHGTKSGTSIGGSSSGMIWHIPKAHLGSVTSVSTIPNTSLFLTGSKDGDVKLWDAKNSQLVFHWQKLHERHTFFQPTSRGFGGVVRAAVTDIQVLSNGFISCGGDGSVKLVQVKNDFAAVHQH